MIERPYNHRRNLDAPTTPIALPPESSLPALLSSEQAAKLCGCGTRTLWRWSRSGVCPAPVKIGGGVRPSIRFRRDELLAWISDGCPRVDGRADR